MYGEIIFKDRYNVEGKYAEFRMYRKEKDDIVEMTLTFKFDRPPEGFINVPEGETVYRYITYPVIADSYESPYLSWDNLLYCSNSYGPVPVIKYMNYAVQNDKKVAANIYPESYEEYMHILADHGDTDIFPFTIEEYEFELMICKKGTLKDYFDMDKILDIYKACGFELDREKIADYFDKKLSWFGEKDCTFDIINPYGYEDNVICGLFFGYPLGSTVDRLKGMK